MKMLMIQQKASLEVNSEHGCHVYYHPQSHPFKLFEHFRPWFDAIFYCDYFHYIVIHVPRITESRLIEEDQINRLKVLVMFIQIHRNEARNF